MLPPVGRLTQGAGRTPQVDGSQGGRQQTEPGFQGRQEERQTEAGQTGREAERGRADGKRSRRRQGSQNALIFRVISGVYSSGLIAD